MRQQLREDIKRVLTGNLLGDKVESILTSGSILKLLLIVVGGNFPIIVVMNPQ